MLTLLVEDLADPKAIVLKEQAPGQRHRRKRNLSGPAPDLRRDQKPHVNKTLR